MGSLYKSTCFAEQSEAKAAFCSDSHAVIGGGTAPLSASCTATDFSQDNYPLRITDGVTATVQTLPYPTFPSCDTSSGVQFVSEFWGIALVLGVVVMCSKVVLNIFRGRQDVV